jgi:superfamily II DNA or RNA helicase/very-short-patch-repair endonuclease
VRIDTTGSSFQTLQGSELIGPRRVLLTAVPPLYDSLSSASFLEYAFLRWVLSAGVAPGALPSIHPQREVVAGGHDYRLDYAVETAATRLAVELDGFEFHGDRMAFTYDRLRQNDLLGAGWSVLRFSYDSIRLETARCVAQLQAVFGHDPELALFLVVPPIVEPPQMPSDLMHAFSRSPRQPAVPATYFDEVRTKINVKTLRMCQREALAALSNYYASGGEHAACVMAVGAGKTALGVVACFALARRRALVITPGTVIRGTFDRAFDHQAVGNALYGLPGGPLIPGVKPPKVRTLDREEGPISGVSREELLAADVIVTNFHSLGTGADTDDLLAKLAPEDVDFIVVDEAHIAAAESYQRTFAHFATARTLLMSACFQRLDGKPIDADVVYRYRLIDSIADGNAKNLRVYRFAPEPEQTIYEMVWPDGSREEIVGRDSLLDVISNERKISTIVAKSDASIRQIMRVVKHCLDEQAELLAPVKPRVLFAALGERHADQVARIASEHGIPSAYLHHSMTDAQIRGIRERFERDSGDLQGIVQLRMLGQGYDFPPITIVVPMRPYGSFAEFYQFVGRGIRALYHPALIGRVGPERQFLDIVYHAEFGLDEHIDTIYRENDMDPATMHELPASWRQEMSGGALPGSRGIDTATHPDAFVVFEAGSIHDRVVHDAARVEQRRLEREREILAARYAAYAATSDDPVTFDQFVALLKVVSGE